MVNILLLRPQTTVKKTIPLSLLYLGSYIKKRYKDNINLQILDLRIHKELNLNMIKNKPDIIGISGLSMEINETLTLAKIMKETFKNTKIILGGALASVEYELLSKNDIFKHIIVGEGEEILCNIIEGKVKDKILFSTNFKEVDINYITYLDYSLINIEDYFQFSSHEVFQKNKRYIPIFTSRGCPFNCGFCIHMFGRKLRFRELKNVVDEIEYLINTYHIKEIHIEDDVFNITKERVIEFFNLMDKKNIKVDISFPNGLIYKTIDEDVVKLFKKNNVYRVCLGIEHTSPYIMKLINKEHDINKLNEVINLLNKYNIMAHGFFITGFPTETIKDFKILKEFITHSKLTTIGISKYIPFYGTPLYTKFLNNEKRDIKDISKSKYHSTNINYSEIPCSIFNKEIISLNKKFYINIRAIKIIRMVKFTFIFRRFFAIIQYVFTSKTKEGA